MFESLALIVSTRNAGKIKELRRLLEPLGFALSTAASQHVPEVDETGDTLAANALLKAAAAFRTTGCCALADDTGLIVDALGGAPGIHAARFAGPDATYDDNNRLLLERLEGVPAERRTASFVCSLALLVPDELAQRLDADVCLGGRDVVEGACLVSVEGRVDGVILSAPQGQGGFGYDPVFYCPELGKSFAEMNLVEKNTVSHRSRALKALTQVLSGLNRPSFM
jgi:XTP/dITP diphosphohydrolase